MIIGIIYMYTAPNDKKYIGQTVNESNRRREWYSSKYKYAGPKINRARKKYGRYNFEYTVLFSKKYTNKIEATSELNILERKFIEKYDTVKKGYNISTGGHQISGYNLHNNHRRKKVFQWDHNGNFIQEYASITEAHKATLIAVSTIRLMCNNKTSGKHSKYLFTFENSFNFEVNSFFVPINMYDINGNFIKRYNTIKSASKELNVNAFVIKKICDKDSIYKSINSVIFTYINDAPILEKKDRYKVYEYNDTILTHVYNTIKEVALKYNINYSVLCRKLKRKDIKLNNKILSLNSYEVK